MRYRIDVAFDVDIDDVGFAYTNPSVHACSTALQPGPGRKKRIAPDGSVIRSRRRREIRLTFAVEPMFNRCFARYGGESPSDDRRRVLRRGSGGVAESRVGGDRRQSDGSR